MEQNPPWHHFDNLSKPLFLALMEDTLSFLLSMVTNTKGKFFMKAPPTL